LIVRSADSSQYLALEEGFSRSLGSQTSLNLADPLAAAGLRQRLDRAGVVFAIGPEALKAVTAEHRDLPTLVAFAFGGGGASAAASPRATTVPLAVSPAQQVSIIKRSLPSIMDAPRQPRLGVLYDPSLSAALVAECSAAASAAGLTLVKAPVARREDVAEAARDLIGRVEALWLIPDPTAVTPQSFRFLVQLSLANKVPLIGFSEGMARAGAVLAIQADYSEAGLRAGLAARKMLDGQPAGLEAPEGMVFLNARTSEMLDIVLPKKARDRATRVFE